LLFSDGFEEPSTCPRSFAFVMNLFVEHGPLSMVIKGMPNSRLDHVLADLLRTPPWRQPTVLKNYDAVWLGMA